MSAPRIALVLNTVGLGGVPEAAFELCRHLPPGRFDLRLFVLKGADDERSAREARAARFSGAGIPVRFAAAGGKLDVVAELADWLATERITLLHTHSYRPNVYGRLAGTLLRPAGLRLLAHYHNQYDAKWARDPTALALERRLAAHTDAFAACSDSVREHVVAELGLAPERCRTVANGVDPGRFAGGDRVRTRAALGLADDELAVGLVGRVCEQKGQEDLVEAMVLLGDSQPRLRVLLAGHAEDRRLLERLQARAAAAGVGDRLRHLGHVDDMAGLYAALDVVAAPSRWEGFGLMLAEAMAAGRPLLAARAGAIPQVVAADETALLVPPRDPPALAVALARLADDPALRARLGAAGPARAARFSWPAAGARLAGIYDAVLAGETPPP